MQTVNLNIIPKGIPDVVNVSQYDIGRTIQFNLYEGAQIYTIPAGATAVIGGKKSDDNIFTYNATISEDRHTVTAITTEQMTAIAGENLCQLRINSVDAEIATINFRMFVQERPDVGDIESVSEIPAIIELARQQQYNAEAWAKGTKNGIDVIPSDPQYNDHAKYWAEVAEQWAEQFINGVVYKGSVLFANIPTTGMLNGWMYNITDAFTTDNRFKEGSGIYCEAGTNIIWNETESLWDLAGGLGGVQSFNGRHGNVMPAANDYSYSQISDTPTLGTAAAKNVPASGDASTTEVVLGNDSRLSDARNAADVSEWAKASTKPSYAYSEISGTPTLGTIASHAFTAINHSVWFYPYIANTEYIPLTDWNPPAAGYMFLFVEQSWNNSMPTYIRVEKYIDSGNNGTKWQPIAVLSIEQANLGIHHLKLPVVTPVAITDKFRFICKGAQNTSGNNQLILNGFVIS